MRLKSRLPDWLAMEIVLRHGRLAEQSLSVERCERPMTNAECGDLINALREVLGLDPLVGVGVQGKGRKA